MTNRHSLIYLPPSEVVLPVAMETRPDSRDMAAHRKLQGQLSQLPMEYFQRCRAAEDNRLKEYTAAVVIQSWFRGCRVRAYLRYLHRMTTVIQKWWRGYLARKHFRSKVKTAFFIMKMDFYNEMAVRIQKRWRGFYVRRHVHNYYALKKYLEGVTVKNNFVRKELEEYAIMRQQEKLKRDLEREERRKEHQARKMHYLLSTEQVAGVFNSPYRQYPDEMEFMLRKARPLSPKEHPEKNKNLDGSLYWSDCRHPYSFPATQPLPPIGKKKPQGPFRDTSEVLQQRYKPLKPTLRVATSFNSVEVAKEEMKRKEWLKIFQENTFAPFSSFGKNTRYEPLIHTSTQYQRVPYGNQHFREVDETKWVTNKDFQNVFTSVELFDKFGRTYSRTGQSV